MKLLLFPAFLAPVAGWGQYATIKNGGSVCNGGQVVNDNSEIMFGEMVGAQRAYTAALWQGIEGRCADSSGIFTLGTYERESDRRDEVIQRTTICRGGAIGREWVQDGELARTRYGVVLNYTKGKNNFFFNQAHGVGQGQY
ncbi:MAG: hypothetical protein LBC42_01485 [Puniceicoccales bacterium]|nr:hypothetical protein [Puniceicoccales bacterium]